MKKFLCIILSAVMLLSVLTLAACTKTDEPTESKTPIESNDPAESVAPGLKKEVVLIPIEPDYFRLICENTDVKILSSNYSRQVYYNLITASPLTEETEFDLSFDKEVNFSFSCSAPQEYAMPSFFNLSTYKNDDWVERADMAKNGDINSASTFNYEASDEQIGLYSYLITVTFEYEQPEKEVRLSKLTFTMNGVSKEYDIGQIFINTDPDANLKIDDTFCPFTLAMTDVNIPVSANGWFEIPAFDVEISDDVIIKDIFTSADDITFTKVSVVQTSTDGTTINYVWDPAVDEPLEFYKGDNVSFNIEAVNPIFENTLSAASIFNLIFSYGGELEGYFQRVEFCFRLRISPIDYYLQYDCGKDVLSYYTAYQPALNEALEDNLD